MDRKICGPHEWAKTAEEAEQLRAEISALCSGKPMTVTIAALGAEMTHGLQSVAKHDVAIPMIQGVVVLLQQLVAEAKGKQQ